MAVEQGPLFPVQEPIAAQTTLLVTPRWRSWLRNLRQEVASTPQRIPVTPVTSGTGSLPVTAIDGGALTTGLFAISWYLAILTAAAGRSVQVTWAWVDGGVNRSYVAAILDGSVSTNAQANEQLLIYSDAASPITYAINYVGAAGMTYSFRPVLQAVSLT